MLFLPVVDPIVPYPLDDAGGRFYDSLVLATQPHSDGLLDTVGRRMLNALMRSDTASGE